MTTNARQRLAAVSVTLALALAVAPAASQAPAALPPVVVSELKVLEETYLVLDAVAQKVWPGWTGYRELPFLFEFENQLQVLVGHPNPPAPFEVVPGLTIGGHAVAADRSKMSAVKVEPPLIAGGGPNNFGTAADGTPVYTVRINVRSARSAGGVQAEDQQPLRTEEKVLIYLHELFHCFQRGRIEPQFGNLQFNADADYATWSQIEGMALERAYNAADAAAARELVREFTVARALKRQSMTDMQRNEESADDVREGTATYAQLRALEIIKSGGFKPGLTNAEDPYYHAFIEADRIIASYAQRLAKAAARHDDPKMKCYDYGSFQCALAERLVPGWQRQVEQGKAIDAVLAGAIPIADAERAEIERRLRANYPYDDVRRGAGAFTDARDTAYRAISSRQGRVYIVDLKPVRQYMDTLTAKAGAYRLGLLTLFPAGYPGFTLDAVEMSPVKIPSNTDQLFYFRAVDTDVSARKRAFTVTGQRQPDGTYVDAVVTTPLFTLRAPKVRIIETGNRVKIQVLARVK
jgi:hypothetical protein